MHMRYTHSSISKQYITVVLVPPQLLYIFASANMSPPTTTFLSFTYILFFIIYNKHII